LNTLGTWHATTPLTVSLFPRTVPYLASPHLISLRPILDSAEEAGEGVPSLGRARLLISTHSRPVLLRLAGALHLRARQEHPLHHASIARVVLDSARRGKVRKKVMSTGTPHLSPTFYRTGARYCFHCSNTSTSTSTSTTALTT